MIAAGITTSEPVFKVEERNSKLVEGAGVAPDGDDGLRPGTLNIATVCVLTLIRHSLTIPSRPVHPLSVDSSGSSSGNTPGKKLGAIPAPSELTIDISAVLPDLEVDGQRHE
jgi:hypothetical protein